jgi:hypothetical protein
MAGHAGLVSPRRLPASFFVLCALTIGATVVRLYAAAHVGFGDSEALYASYALHPQPAYLDHPALVALLAAFAGGGTSPEPLAAHQVTTALAGVVPWLAALAARGAGASWRASFTAAAALALVPEIAVGLVAMTPDLALAPAWIGSLGCAALGLRMRPHQARTAWLLAGAGVLAGVACAAKATGALLVVSLVATYLSPHGREHRKTLWPWVGLAAGLVVVVPIALYESHVGWPMLQHRLVDTQSESGVSLRNLGALLGGQLLYRSPLYAVAAVFVARDLLRTRNDDAVSTLLLYAFAIPLAALVVLALWSRVAEPHWLAPPLLALPIHYARVHGRGTVGRRLGAATVASGLVLSAAVYAWVLVPTATKLLPDSADPRFDIANELYGWPRVSEAVLQVVKAEEARAPDDTIAVVGPHWIICAQLHAALRKEVDIGCDTPVPDDFDRWMPRARWHKADKVLFVTDNRFDVDARKVFPDRARTLEWEVTVTRGGRVTRVFTLSLFEKRAGA